MRKDRRAVLIFSHAALVGTLLSITSASAQTYDKNTPPPRPAWVGADGKVLIDKAPKEVSVAGPDGNLVKDASGKERKVPTHFVPPPPVRVPSPSQR
jgi:hypothetical protein